MKPIYKRVLIKLSGQALGENEKGLCAQTIEKLSDEIVELALSGMEIALVIGGGNIWRGREGSMMEMDRTTADHMGMLATVINALAVQDAIERAGKGRRSDGTDVQCRVQTAIEMRQIAEPFIRRKAVRHLEKGRIVIFACGTGNPFFTTDTAAALRANEIGAEALLFAKSTDSVYTADPRSNPNAQKIERISYMEMLEKGIAVMDNTAITLCMDNKVPIFVFGIGNKNITKTACGEHIGTIVS